MLISSPHLFIMWLSYNSTTRLLTIRLTNLLKEMTWTEINNIALSQDLTATLSVNKPEFKNISIQATTCRIPLDHVARIINFSTTSQQTFPVYRQTVTIPNFLDSSSDGNTELGDPANTQDILTDTMADYFVGRGNGCALLKRLTVGKLRTTEGGQA